MTSGRKNLFWLIVRGNGEAGMAPKGGQSRKVRDLPTTHRKQRKKVSRK